MKINCALVFTVITLTATSGFGQGKGGDKGGGNSGSNKGGGPDRPSAASPRDSGSKPHKPDHPHADGSVTSRSDQAVAKAHGAGAAQAHGLGAPMQDINRTTFAQRRELHDTVDLRLKSSRDALKAIQSNAKDLRADARADFKAALDTAKKRENELNAALKASRKADEKGWNASREALARAYQGHNDAMTRLAAIPRPPTP